VLRRAHPGLGAVVALATLLTPLAAEARSFTLSDTVTEAVRVSDLVAAAEASTLGEQAKLDGATAMLFPSLTFGAGYAHLDTAPYMDVEFDIAEMMPADMIDNPIIGPYFEDAEPTRIQMELGRKDNIQFQLQGQQVLFAGTGLHRQRAMAVAELRSAEQQERAARHDAAYEAEAAFWRLALARQAREVTAEAIETAEAHVGLLGTFVEAGLASEADLLAARVQLASLRVDVLRAAQGAELAEGAFRMLLQVPDDEPVELEADAGGLPLQLPEQPEELWALARESRPEARILDQQMMVARHGAQGAWASWLPALVLQGNVYAKNPDRQQEPKFYWSADVTVGLQWSLWDQGAAISRHRQARAGQARIDAYRRQLRAGIKLQVESALATWRQSQLQVDAATEALDLAERSLELVRINFAEGLARNVDVMGAQTAHSKAQLDLFAAQTDLHVAEAEVRRAIGMDLAG
jgi:outer membrane protein